MRFVLFLVLWAMVINSSGQTSQSSRPFTREPRDRFVMDFHHDFLNINPQNCTIRPWSPGFNAALMFDIPVNKSFFSIAFGMGFSSFNLHSNGYFTRGFENDIKFIALQPSEYSKNKLSVNFIEVPVELRIRSNSASPYKIYLGGSVGYAVNTHTKVIDDLVGKRKFYDVWGLEKLRFSGTIRIGKGRISGFGFYSFSPLFKAKNAPEWNPMGAGLSFHLF